MPNIVDYLKYSETAFAAYAIGLQLGNGNAQVYRDAEMASSQAQRFDETWRVLGQKDIGDGFSAVLFQEVNTQGQPVGQKVLAIRGSETSHWGIDYGVDLISVLLLGTAAGSSQYNSLQDFYLSLIGQSKLSAVENIVVTGHSLGGFLAQAFAAKHLAVSAAYTYNAPGFSVAPYIVSNLGTELLKLFGLSGTIPNDKIVNIRALDGISGTAGLGQMIGSIQTVNIEAGDPIHNHSIVTLTDALALYKLYAALSPSLSIEQIGKVLRSASAQNVLTLERSLDALRVYFEGEMAQGSGQTPSENRSELYTKLYALENSDGYRAMAGSAAVRVTGEQSAATLSAQAKQDFGYFMSLRYLLPVALEGISSVVIAANSDLYARWQADRAKRIAGAVDLEFTDTYLADRAAMLASTNTARTQDSLTIASFTIAGATEYFDQATDLRVRAYNPAAGEFRKVYFGGDGADSLVGAGQADRLYGGSGNDTLTGGKGNEYLEGGAGNDTYIYSLGDGLDTIFDSDGVGSIQMDLVTLVGGTSSGDGRSFKWTDSNGKEHSYVLLSGDLTSGGDLLVDEKITIKNFKNGNLGLTLNTTQQTPQTGLTIVGDLEPINFALPTDPPGTVSWHYDALGNVIVSGNPEPNRNDYINGSSGNDRIEGGGGGDYLWGQGGEDVVIGYGTLSGGVGNDYISVGQEVSITDAINNGNAQQGTSGGGSYLVGDSNFRDAPGGRDILIGGAGNDEIQGDGGQDILIGGAGDDDISGDNWFQSWVYNPTGALVTSGDPMYAAMYATRPFWGINNSIQYLPSDGGADVIYAGNGADFVWGGVGDDVIFGEGGADRLVGESGNDIILGGNDDDVLWGDGGYNPGLVEGSDYLDGGAGDDIIYGGGGDDVLIGGSGSNILYGGAGNDTYIFERGSQNTVYDTGANTYRFGDGFDPSTLKLRTGSLLLDFGDGSEVHLANFDAQDPYATLSGAEFEFADGATLNVDELLARGIELEGTDQDDTLIGTASPENIHGHAGDDVLIGGGGNDSYFFNRGDGADTIVDHGNALPGGSNTLSFGDGIAPADVSVTLSPERQIRLDLGAGDRVDIGPDYDLAVQNVHFADGSVFSTGDFLDQRGIEQTGTADGEQLSGTMFTDRLQGLAGDDTLQGGAGGDTLEGGTGNDTLIGGYGTDTYVYKLGDGADTLIDGRDPFTGEGNTLRFGAGIDADSIGAQWNGGTVTLDLGNGDLISTGSLINLAVNNLEFDDGTLLGMGAFLAQKGVIQLTGTPGNDVMATFGNGLPLRGLGGDDVLYGSFADDTLEGGAGNDLLIGNAGSDTYIYNLGDGADEIADYGDPGAGDVNILSFGAGIAPDMISPLYNGDALALGLGDGDNIAIGAMDELAIQKLQFADGSELTVDQLIALRGGFLQVGTPYNDLIDGTLFGDRLEGLAGDDTLYGHEGNDMLIGGPGNDTLAGGEGDDSYIFNRGDGADVIDDMPYHWDGEFQIAEVNTLKLGAGITPSMLTPIVDQNQNVTLDLGDGDNVQIGSQGELAVQSIVFADGRSYSIEGMLSGKPVASPIADQVTHQGDSFSFSGAANAIVDFDGDSLSYSATLVGGGTLPAWLAFDVATGTFSGVPGNVDVASLDLAVTATDPSSFSAVSTFKLDVLNVNDAPTVVGALQDQTATVGQAFSYSLSNASPPDGFLIDETDTGTADQVWPGYDNSVGGGVGNDTYTFARDDGNVYFFDWDPTPGNVGAGSINKNE